MTGTYQPPLVGENQISNYDAFVAANAEYMATPAESEPPLFQLLPLSREVPPPFELAGVYAQTPTANPRRPSITTGPSPSSSVTAAYAPDGTLDWPLRTLVTRLALFDDEEHTHEDIEACCERKVEEEFGGEEEDPTTEWIDTTYHEETVGDYRRTTFSHRQPLLYKYGQYDGGVSRPVFVFAFALQVTDWGFVETGLYLSPDPDPGSPLDIVETVTDTLTNRAERLPTPTSDPDWPHLHLHDQSQADIVADARTHLDEWADDGAVNAGRLIEAIRDEYDIPNEVVRAVIAALTETGALSELDAGYYELV